MEIITSFSTRILSPMATLNNHMNQLFALLEELCNESYSVSSDKFILPSSKNNLNTKIFEIKMKIYMLIDQISFKKMQILEDQIKKWPLYISSWSKS